jgi:pimeloyl-ACP methyl ester carboxylesterase
VAAESFSDLRTVAQERAPWVLTRGVIERAFAIAERDGHFSVSEVSPRAAARRIHAPVLLVHGALDRDTPPAHSERIYAELPGPKRLLLVPGAHHNTSLSSSATWAAIETWIDGAVEDPSSPRHP